MIYKSMAHSILEALEKVLFRIQQTLESIILSSSSQGDRNQFSSFYSRWSHSSSSFSILLFLLSVFGSFRLHLVFFMSDPESSDVTVSCF